MFGRRLACHVARKTGGSFLIVAGVVALAGPAGATFTGGNGDIAFASICDSTIGQAIYSVDPTGSGGGSPPTSTCPGGTAPNYTQSSAGATDSMPFFSSLGTTMYFASNRRGNFAIYDVSYPSTVSGSPGSQTDGATALTSPTGANDYAPVVSSDGSTLAFLRCTTTTSCSLYEQSPVSGGTPTAISTTATPAAPDPNSGAGSRPEFDPVDPTTISYVGTDHHVHVLNLTTSTDTDLSALSGIPTGDIDEYPDWSPDGTTMVFDSNQVPSGDTHATGTHYIWKTPVTSPSRTALWPSADPGNEIEPIFAPPWTQGGGGEYAWTVLGGGSNIQLDDGVSVSSPMNVVDLTNNRSNNSQPVWDPVQPGSGTPEAPVVLLLPAAGLIAGGVGWLAVARRPRRTIR